MKYDSKGVRGAFTVVELLVTICVIAILTALSLSATRKAFATSRTAKCTTQLRQIAVAFNTYSADNSGLLPVIDMWTTTNSSDAKMVFWITEIAPYLKIPGYAQSNPYFRCPEVMAYQSKSYSSSSSLWRYGLNSGLSATDSYGAKTGVTLASLGSPSQKVMLFCTGRGWTSLWYSIITGYGAGVGYGPFSGAVNAPFFAEVHSGKANVLFADGHVAAAKFIDTTAQDWAR